MNMTEISLTVTLNNQFITIPWKEKWKESYTLTTTPITQFKLGVRKAHFKLLNTSTGKMIAFKFLARLHLSAEELLLYPRRQRRRRRPCRRTRRRRRPHAKC